MKEQGIDCTKLGCFEDHDLLSMATAGASSKQSLNPRYRRARFFPSDLFDDWTRCQAKGSSLSLVAAWTAEDRGNRDGSFCELCFFCPDRSDCCEAKLQEAEAADLRRKL